MEIKKEKVIKKLREEEIERRKNKHVKICKDIINSVLNNVFQCIDEDRWEVESILNYRLRTIIRGKRKRKEEVIIEEFFILNGKDWIS